MEIQSKILALSLTLALASAPILHAQPAEGARERGPGGPGGGRGPSLEQLSEQLSLTADQKAKLGPILKQQAEQMQSLRKDESLSQDQRRDKAKALREENQKAIAAVLTPEQAAKLAELRARGPGGPGGPRGEKGEKSADHK